MITLLLRGICLHLELMADINCCSFTARSLLLRSSPLLSNPSPWINDQTDYFSLKHATLSPRTIKSDVQLGSTEQKQLEED